MKKEEMLLFNLFFSLHLMPHPLGLWHGCSLMHEVTGSACIRPNGVRKEWDGTDDGRQRLQAGERDCVHSWPFESAAKQPCMRMKNSTCKAGRGCSAKGEGLSVSLGFQSNASFYLQGNRNVGEMLKSKKTLSIDRHET